MIKTKIQKILPIWLIVLALFCSAQTAGILASKNNQITRQQEAVAAKPEVLGAQTNIRGQPGQTAVTEIEQLSQPDLSKITAKSFLVFDLAGGQNLLEKNADQKLPIASLTKLLTAFITYQNSDLGSEITIEPKDVFQVSPVLGLKAGDQVKELDIFNAMLIGSCNDAALTLSNHVETLLGQNFVGLMNNQAEALGMLASHFGNALGFDQKDNYSTTLDLKILITATQNLAAFKNLGRQANYQLLGSSGRLYSTVTTNKLIADYPDLQAIKTGTTQEAGEAMATKLEAGGREIVILVLGSKNREADTLSLRSAVLSNFKLQ